MTEETILPKRGRGRPPGPAKPKTPRSTKKIDYTESITGLFQIAAVPLAYIAPEDGFAVSAHGPNIASSLNDLAQERPEIAAVLDKVMAVGPYGALIGATLPLVAQILVNHKTIPIEVGSKLGAHPKEAITAHLKGEAIRIQQEAAQAQAEAEKAAQQFMEQEKDLQEA